MVALLVALRLGHHIHHIHHLHHLILRGDLPLMDDENKS
jgi:hypothetical protein